MIRLRVAFESHDLIGPIRTHKAGDTQGWGHTRLRVDGVRKVRKQMITSLVSRRKADTSRSLC